jgi:hypothetical protein
VFEITDTKLAETKVVVMIVVVEEHVLVDSGFLGKRARFKRL